MTRKPVRARPIEGKPDRRAIELRHLISALPLSIAQKQQLVEAVKNFGQGEYGRGYVEATGNEVRFDV